MNRQFVIAVILAALIALAAAGHQAHAATPTNTPVGRATWTAQAWPTSSAATNTPVIDARPLPTSTQLPVIGDPWFFGPRVWLPCVMR